MAITKNSQIDLNGNEMILDADGDTTITADTDDQIDIKVAGSDKVQINATGLGIGQVPTRDLSLHAGDASSVFAHFTNTDTGTTSSDGLLIGLGSSEDLVLNNQESSKNIIIENGGSERMRITSAGKVGIATTSPLYELDVNGEAYIRTRLFAGDGSASSASIRFYNASSGLYHPGSDALGFTANGAERMRIDSAGHLLVGTTSKYSGTNGNLTVPLQLDLGANDTNSKYVFVNRSASTGVIGGFRAAVTGFSTMGRVELQADNVGGGAQTSSFHVYTTLNATEARKMQIDGNGHVYFTSLNSASGSSDVHYNTSSGNLYYVTSSRRYKENIKDMPDGVLDKIKQARAVTFNEKESGDSSYGLIAEELEELIPELVVKREIDGEELPDSITYSMLSVYLLKAIQEQQAQIEALQSEINALKGG